MKAYSKTTESNKSKSSSPNTVTPFFLPQGKASDSFGNSEEKESNYFFKRTDVLQRKNIEHQPVDDEKEELIEILNTLISLLNLEDSIVLVVGKPNIQNYIQRLEIFYESAKEVKSRELASMFQDKYNKMPSIFGSEYYMYKEDIEKIYKKINEEKWDLNATIKDVEDILELKKLIEWHINYTSHCYEDNPLTFSISKEEIDEITRTWQNINTTFIKYYEASNDRVKNIFKETYNSFKQEDVNSISQKLKSNRLKKDSKDKFDESQSKMNADDQIKSDPPLPGITGIKYQDKNYGLFEKGKKDSHEIDSNDIKQGQLGNCYYLSTIASIAKIHPDYFKGIIKQVPGKENYYQVTFFIQELKEKEFKKYDVFVDNDIPVVDFSPYFAGKGDDELWVILLEKALAKLFGGYQSIESGSPEFAFGLLTGKIIQRININEFKDEDITLKLEGSKNSKPIIFTSKASATTPVFSNHAYYFESILNGLINLGNPHGKDHLNNLTLSSIRANFETIFIGENIK